MEGNNVSSLLCPMKLSQKSRKMISSKRTFLESARIAHKVADFGLNVNYNTNLSKQVVKLS